MDDLTTFAFASHLTTIVYAVVCLGDLVMTVIFVGNALACVVIVAVTAYKRYSFSRQTREVSPDRGKVAPVFRSANQNLRLIST